MLYISSVSSLVSKYFVFEKQIFEILIGIEVTDSTLIKLKIDWSRGGVASRGRNKSENTRYYSQNIQKCIEN